MDQLAFRAARMGLTAAEVRPTDVQDMMGTIGAVFHER
jgi:hypothetical protein